MVRLASALIAVEIVWAKPGAPNEPVPLRVSVVVPSTFLTTVSCTTL